MKLSIRGTGRLTANPELKKTQSGGQICNFSIATNSGKEDAQFHNCRAFGNTAEFVQKYFVKGKPIEFAGWLAQSEYDDKETGKKRRYTYIEISQVGFVPSEPKKDGEYHASGESNSQGKPAETENADDDMPF